MSYVESGNLKPVILSVLWLPFSSLPSKLNNTIHALVTHTLNPSTQGPEAGYPVLHSEFSANQSYTVRLCLSIYTDMY